MIGHRRTCESILVLSLCGVLAGLGSVAASAQEEAAPAQAAPKTFLPASVVILDGKAQANGVLAFVFEPEGGEAKQVRVNVVKKTKANKIALDLQKEFAFTAGEGYKVTLSGDKKVVVKAKSKKIPSFSLRVDQQSVNGVSVRIKKK